MLSIVSSTLRQVWTKFALVYDCIFHMATNMRTKIASTDGLKRAMGTLLDFLVVIEQICPQMTFLCDAVLA